MRCLALVAAATLIVAPAAAQTTQVLVKMDASTKAGRIKDLSKEFGAKVERTVPGLNATILRVPTEDVGKLINSGKPGISAIELLNGSDYRQLFKTVSSADFNPTSLSKMQTDAISKLRERPSTGSMYVSEIRPGGISTDLLRGALTTADGFSRPNGIKLNLAPGVTVDATQTGIDQQSGGGFVWYGKIENRDAPAGKTDGGASLVVEGNRISGTVAVGSDVYTINPLGEGVHAIIKTNPKTYPREHPPGSSPASPTNAPSVPQRGGALRDQGPAMIRALVLYTPAVGQAVGSVGRTPQGIARDAVANTNLASRNSRVAMNLVLANVTELSYTETDFDTDLAMLHSSTAVAQLRDAAQAHVVFLLTTINTYCGLADAIMAEKASAFAVVNYDCAVGNLSLAHEFGHLLGLRHDRGADPADKPFKDGHGYAYRTDWRTIMAYADACGFCTRMPIWSNPNLKYNGVPSGTREFENEAGVINQTAPIVAKFK